MLFGPLAVGTVGEAVGVAAVFDEPQPARTAPASATAQTKESGRTRTRRKLTERHLNLAWNPGWKRARALPATTIIAESP